MNIEEFKNLIQDIVKESGRLKDKHTDQKDASVNYAAIFCQSDKEYNDFLNLANQLGRVFKETQTGPLFLIDLDTESGKLKLLKIRKPDETRKERGDADFTVDDYNSFKENYLSKPGFSLIERDNFEMMELIDPNFNVRTYFSNPPLDQQFGL
jgi:hypothetical protein